MSKTYCYHTTNGITRSALSCGTVKASSMEEAGEIAAKMSKIKRVIGENIFGEKVWHWMKDNKKVCIYIALDPDPPSSSGEGEDVFTRKNTSIVDVDSV